ncbi:hypothetical protein ACGC1H_000709 [Rhizoctonia solani]|uniref:Uncharacterized protein n=1 Tax=Rhizoctonia solani TaxID=456999 RepID=A0A8H3AGG2_9AGAM|nr:unnamed protein product [Rhizoctonia solani]
MSQQAFPAELVQCIGEYLDDSLTLASLCLVDKQTLGLVTPLLYASVHITTPRAILSFCNAILQSSRDLGRYLKVVHVDPPNPTDVVFSSLIEAIHLALHKAPNLKNLSLHIDTPNTLILFRHGWAPFTLRRFASFCTIKPYFLFDFLFSQPSIQDLTIYEPCPRDKYPRHSIRSVPPDILPNLTSIRADPLTIHAFVPGRPISRIDSGQAIFMPATTHLLCDALKSSTAPNGIQSISACVSVTRFWTGASEFITRLEGVCGGSLREMIISMPELSVGMMELHNHAPLVEVLAASLEGFTRLEHFEFRDKGIEIITPDILVDGLDKAGTLMFWKAQIKSLKSVKLFGVSLI